MDQQEVDTIDESTRRAVDDGSGDSLLGVPFMALEDRGDVVRGGHAVILDHRNDLAIGFGQPESAQSEDVRSGGAGHPDELGCHGCHSAIEGIAVIRPVDDYEFSAHGDELRA